MKNIGDEIARLRKAKRMSQVEIARRLEDYGIHIKNAAVSCWEQGVSIPTSAQLLALCEILEVRDIYKEFIGENPQDPFRNLNEAGIAKVRDYIDLLEKSGEYRKQTAKVIPIKMKKVKMSLLQASAGTGNFLDEENFEHIEVPASTVPKKADFCLHIDGDSMEPQFNDGELVWIEQTEDLESGDIGLFYLDGMTYFKKLVKKATGTFLVSLNPKYPPKQVQEFNSFKVFGKLATLSN